MDIQVLFRGGESKRFQVLLNREADKHFPIQPLCWLLQV